MNDTKIKPECVKDGITFWPIPDVTDTAVAFGADGSDYFQRRALPEVPEEFRSEVSRLFFEGGKLPELGSGVDKRKAARWVRSRLASFAPAHEAKESTVAYALWLWSPESDDVRA